MMPASCGSRGTSPPENRRSVRRGLGAGNSQWLTFHGDRARTGWNMAETTLVPANVRAGSFGPVWSTPRLDTVTIGGVVLAPHIFASPLFVNDVAITSGPFAGASLNTVFVATGNGFVYAVNAFDNPTAPAGTILWRRSLGTPSRGPDGGVPLGVLGTPAIDLDATPPRLYVASDVAGATRSWQVFALDLGSGEVLPGWPLALNDSTLRPINQNGPATFQAPGTMSQRGGLNISLDGRILYVPFGSYSDGGAGWMVAVTTGVGTELGLPALASAFSGAPWTRGSANGGMWASGGAAIDDAGYVYVTTGNSPTGPADATWGESLLVFEPGLPLRLSSTYTPWNHCQMDDTDIDLCGSAPVILPEVDPATTTTPHLLTFGGKQGNGYLIDRDNIAGGTDRRPACNRTTPTGTPPDTSLWGPTGRSYYNGSPGPLNIFGPYTERSAQGNNARARSTPAYYRGSDGTNYLFFTGSTKMTETSIQTVPPCFTRVRVITNAAQPAHLEVDAAEPSLIFNSPGTPVVSSNNSDTAIVWVVEPNVRRGDGLIGPGVPHPTLYAIDANTLAVLYRSDPADLEPGGKYFHPIVANGTVFVATDRLTAFGLTSP